MRVLIRADASLQIGTGHVMRCLTLAKALRREGVVCEFLCRPQPGDRIGLIEDQGFTAKQLPPLPPPAIPLDGYLAWLGTTEEADAQHSLDAIQGIYDLMIVDHYALSAIYEGCLRPACRRIMAIDDLANRKHDCDLLLDQNLLPDMAIRYRGLLPEHCHTLLGPEYALLRDEYCQTAVPRSDTPQLLINFGGNDIYGLTMLALDVIETLDIPKLKVDIVIADTHPQLEAITQRCDHLPQVQLHRQINHMAKLMQQATLMLGTGGTTHWERCATRLPSLIITVAENQLATTKHLHELGVCIWLGNDEDIDAQGLRQAVEHTINNATARRQMSERCKHVMTDGNGAQKVARVITHHAW